MTIGAKIGAGRTAEIFSWGDDHIVKLFYAGYPMENVQREALLAWAASKAGVMTPAVGEVVDINGRIGLIYGRVRGEILLKHMLAKPHRVLSFAKMMAELHVSLHRKDVEQGGLPFLHDKLQNHIQRHFNGNEQAALLDYLDTLPQGSALCHYDFHVENIIISENGAVIIDWMNGAVGHHLADVARTALMLSDGAPPDANLALRLLIKLMRGLFHRTYINHYCRLSGTSKSEIERWLPITAVVRLAEGIPGEEVALRPIIAKVIDSTYFRHKAPKVRRFWRCLFAKR